MGNAEPAEALGLFGKLVLDCDSNPDKPWLRTSDEHSTTFGGKNLACPMMTYTAESL